MVIECLRLLKLVQYLGIVEVRTFLYLMTKQLFGLISSPLITRVPFGSVEAIYQEHIVKITFDHRFVIY